MAKVGGWDRVAVDIIPSGGGHGKDWLDNEWEEDLEVDDMGEGRACWLAWRLWAAFAWAVSMLRW